MKNHSLLVLLLAIGISIALSPSVRADFFSAATNTGSQGGTADLAGDITSLFAVDSESARNLADVHGFCTESPQQGNWESDPRTYVEYPDENIVNEPRITFAANTLQTYGGNPTRGWPVPTDPTPTSDPTLDPTPEDPTIVPEPATMLLLGIGAAGLIPFSRRRCRKG